MSQLKSHQDTYACVGINLCHLRSDDKHILNCCSNSGMVLERDSGWFVKLYEFEESEASSISTFFESMYEGISSTLLTIFCAAYEAGYRLIEFDMDAQEVDGFPVFED